MTTLDYIQEKVSEIKERRIRIASLGGALPESGEFAWLCGPGEVAVNFIEDMADSLRAQQEKLESAALRRAGTGA